MATVETALVVVELTTAFNMMSSGVPEDKAIADAGKKIARLGSDVVRKVIEEPRY